MSEIIVFNGWAYKSDIWNDFIGSEYDLFESKKTTFKRYKKVYAWSLGVLQCLEFIEHFDKECEFHFYSPCLSFIERNGFSGNTLESLKQMKLSLNKSTNSTLSLFHRKTKSALPKSVLDIESPDLEFGLNQLEVFDFTSQSLILNSKVHLYAAKGDSIISLRQSEEFAEKYSLPLEVFDTFSHSFFLENYVK